MIYLVYGASIMVFVFATIYSIHAMVEGGYVARGISVIFWILTFAFISYEVIEADRKGPCVKYETQLHYSPAIKMMMPARVCVNRSEWVE